MKLILFYFVFALVAIETVFAQAYIGGAYDFGQNRYGERRGDLGPMAIAGIAIGGVAVIAALVVTVFFCYYATSKSTDFSQPRQYPNQYHKPRYELAQQQ